MSKSLSKEDTSQENPFQAIVFCDTWGDEARWGPLVRQPKETDEDELTGEKRPWFLLPLMDIPLIAWTLECLVTGGVEEVFLFINQENGVKELRNWLASSTYSKPHSGIQVTIRPTASTTPGDILREVDSLGILSPDDFLVVQAGYVGNIDLVAKREAFREKKKSDPNMLMSVVVAEFQVPTTSRYSVHVIGDNDRLLHYEQSVWFPRLDKVSLPREIIGTSDLKVRTDLEATGLAICQFEVPQLFTENFDYQFFFPDFVNGILTSDLLGKTMCCTIIGSSSEEKFRSKTSSEWAGAVSNTRSYDWVSKSILSRKVYPFTPDENLPEQSERYYPRRGPVYYGRDLDIARSCSISPLSFVGHQTTISSSAKIESSTLSELVSVGTSSIIKNSYIFASTSVGSNCQITNSFIGENCIISDNAILDKCIVGSGARIGAGAKLTGVWVSKENQPGRINENADATSLGENSTGFIWNEQGQLANSEDSDDDEDLDPRNIDIAQLGSLGTLHINSSTSTLSLLSRTSSAASLSSMATSLTGDVVHVEGLDNLSTNPASVFMNECIQSLDRSFTENHTVENAAIELKTLRMAANVPLERVREVVVPYVFARCKTPAEVSVIIKRWGGLLASLTGELEEGMAHTILLAQKHASSLGDEKVLFFLQSLKNLYETDVIDEDSAFTWYKDPESRTSDILKKLWEASKKFVQALMEDSDEDEDEDDSN